MPERTNPAGVEMSNPPTKSPERLKDVEDAPQPQGARSFGFLGAFDADLYIGAPSLKKFDQNFRLKTETIALEVQTANEFRPVYSQPVVVPQPESKHEIEKYRISP